MGINRNSFITYDNSYFKINDEDRAICEDMYGDRAQNHDTDLEFHYDSCYPLLDFDRQSGWSGWLKTNQHHPSGSLTYID